TSGEPPGTIETTSKQENDYEYDVLCQNQRGFFFIGKPRFSSNVLNQLDPAPWTDRHGCPSQTNVYDTPLPDPTWEWVHKLWLIDMSGDVDEGGWEYSFNFRGYSWHGICKPFRSFVRRRRWIRLRKKGLPLAPNPRLHEHDLLDELKAARLDRERLDLIKKYIDSHPNLDIFDNKMAFFLNVFDNRESKKKFLELLTINGREDLAKSGMKLIGETGTI
ncbi:10582_t:CDS:2, partial [Paraglomus brasilianum]